MSGQNRTRNGDESLPAAPGKPHGTPETRPPLSTRISQAVRTVPRSALPSVLLCGIIGAISAPLITISISQTPIPDGDLPAPMLTIIPAALAGCISGVLYAAKRLRMQHSNAETAEHRWRSTLLHPAIWGLATAVGAGVLASFVILLPITVTMALVGAVFPGQLGIVRTFDQPFRALASIPPLTWSPLIAAVMRGVTGTRLGSGQPNGPGEVLRRAVPLAMPFILAAALNTSRS